MSQVNEIHRVHTITSVAVTLEDVEPQLQRQIEVSQSIRLDCMRFTLQAALGWTNSHLYELRVRQIGYGIPQETMINRMPL